jgi:hypothetical protein
MATLRERELLLTLPPGAHGVKYDTQSRPLQHCMKAVDFVVETNNAIYFFELKDPDNPKADPGNRAAFIEDIRSGKLDEDLKYKYRDTFLQHWAEKRVNKPVRYIVIIALSSLNAPELMNRTDALRRKIPCPNEEPKSWKQSIITDCFVFNIETFNKSLHGFRLERT